jgi:hypothetical protein
MHTLHRYTIRYRFNGEPLEETMDSFEPVTQEQAIMQLLIKHVPEPTGVIDARWELHAQPSIERRAVEVGLSDVCIEERA